MKKGLHLCRPFFNLADSGGFEPPTARFVAEYSIQLSYESILRFYTSSPLVTFANRITAIHFVNGALRRIRTSDRSVRSRVLYPAAL